MHLNSGLSSSIGSFIPDNTVTFTEKTSVVDEALYFELPAFTSIGSLTHDCFKDFTGCESGYALNFWYNADEISTLNTEYEVLNLGEFKWFVTYTTGSAEGVLVWQQENDCKLSFPCLLYTSPSPRDATLSRMPSSA